MKHKVFIVKVSESGRVVPVAEINPEKGIDPMQEAQAWIKTRRKADPRGRYEIKLETIAKPGELERKRKAHDDALQISIGPKRSPKFELVGALPQRNRADLYEVLPDGGLLLLAPNIDKDQAREAAKNKVKQYGGLYRVRYPSGIDELFPPDGAAHRAADALWEKNHPRPRPKFELVGAVPRKSSFVENKINRIIQQNRQYPGTTQRGFMLSWDEVDPEYLQAWREDRVRRGIPLDYRYRKDAEIGDTYHIDVGPGQVGELAGPPATTAQIAQSSVDATLRSLTREVKAAVARERASVPKLAAEIVAEPKRRSRKPKPMPTYAADLAAYEGTVDPEEANEETIPF